MYIVAHRSHFIQMFKSSFCLLFSFLTYSLFAEAFETSLRTNYSGTMDPVHPPEPAEATQPNSAPEINALGTMDPAPRLELSATAPPSSPEFLFDSINKDQLLICLKAWKSDQTKNGKGFYASYGNIWVKLNDSQKIKTKSFWMEQLSDPQRLAIFNKAESAFALGHTATKEREQQSNFNDYARLLHLKKDGKMVTAWNNAFDEKTRNEIDDADGYLDPYSILAEAFNDYSNFKYENASYPKLEHDKNGMMVITSYDEALNAVAKRCHDINPNDSNRPKRDGNWIKSKWKELNSSIAKQYAKYATSGRQDGSNIETLWVEFLDHGQDTVNVVVYYVICLFNLSELNTIGKILPREIQANSTFIDLSTSNDVAAASYVEAQRKKKTEQRRRQRRAKKLRETVGDNGDADLNSSFDSVTDDNSNAMARVLDERLKDHNRSQEEMFTFNWMMTHGTKSDKKRVQAAMRQKFESICLGNVKSDKEVDVSSDDSLAELMNKSYESEDL